METVLKRFPFASKIILKKLDDQSLARSKEASRGITEFLENERFYWIRIIQKYNDDCRQVIKKTSIKDLKELAIQSEKSFWIRMIQDYVEEYIW